MLRTHEVREKGKNIHKMYSYYRTESVQETIQYGIQEKTNYVLPLSENCENRLLASSCLSVRPSVCMLKRRVLKLRNLIRIYNKNCIQSTTFLFNCCFKSERFFKTKIETLTLDIKTDDYRTPHTPRTVSCGAGDGYVTRAYRTEIGIEQIS